MTEYLGRGGACLRGAGRALQKLAQPLGSDGAQLLAVKLLLRERLRVRAQWLKHARLIFYLQNECAHVGLSVTMPESTIGNTRRLPGAAARSRRQVDSVRPSLLSPAQRATHP